MFLIIVLITIITSGCATATHYDTRPFFLPERNVATHGRKTWFDHLVEFDPGRARVKATDAYSAEPPEVVAVLPFVDYGTGEYRIDKIPVSFRNRRERQEWAWTYANRVRRSFTGQLAEREFMVVPIPLIDTALRAHGVDNWAKLMAVPPRELGQWLGADTVVYGEVMHYDAYYAFLISAWQVAVGVQMYSTHDGRKLFSATDGRYAVNVSPAVDLMDIGINSVLSALELRDVTLARAEYEVSREIAIRVPTSYRALTNLQLTALDRGGADERLADSVAGIPAAPAAVDSPAGPAQSPKLIGDRKPLRMVSSSPRPAN